MKKTSKKLVALVLASLMCATAVPTFAGNREFSFSLKTTSSSQGTSATKDDSDTIAYLKASSMSKDVSTNFRVRHSNGNEATYMITLLNASNLTHQLNYKSYLDAKEGATYYIWANLNQAQSSYISISGTWCP